MMRASPGFIGGRLREARESRGLTGTSLAQIVGVSRQAVSQYESGQSSPSPEVLGRLASTLNLPVRFFSEPLTPEEEASKANATLFWRSMSAATATSRLIGKRRLLWAINIANYLAESVEYPPLNLPPLQLSPADPNSLTTSAIEDAASYVREYWSINDLPVGNVAWLLENNGIMVVRTSLESDRLDSASIPQTDTGRPFIILNTNKASAVRSRFDAAHELGHILLHRNVPENHLAAASTFKLMESQAHRFAASFLLPEQPFARDFDVQKLEVRRMLEALQILKSKWRVSIAAMIHRASELRMLSDEQQRRLWRGMSSRGWRRREPYDDEWDPEEPQLLKRSVELLVSELGLSRAVIRMDLPYSRSDIEDIVGLSPGYLSDEPPSVHMVSPRTRGAQRQSERSAKNATITPFHPNRGRR